MERGLPGCSIKQNNYSLNLRLKEKLWYLLTKKGFCFDKSAKDINFV